jgi:hypothetical protein
MQHAGALQQPGQGGWLGPKFSRFIHHPRAAWWAALVALSGLAQAAFWIVLAFGYSAYMVTVLDRKQPTDLESAVVLVASLVLAVAVGVYLGRTEENLEPPRQRIPHKRWSRYANGTGAIIFVGVAFATWWLWFVVLAIVLWTARLVLPIPHLDVAVFYSLSISVPLLLALWGFLAWRGEILRLLEKAQAPEMRLATKVVRYADEFQERAKALEQAMEEAAAVSKKVQHGIELEQEQLRELREQYRLHVQLIELSDRAPTIRTAIAQEHARGARWGLMVNVVVAAIFLVIGLLIDALVDTEVLGDQLRQWFHLG